MTITGANLLTIRVIDQGNEEELRESPGVSVDAIRRKCSIPPDYTCYWRPDGGSRGTVPSSYGLTASGTLEFVPTSREKA